MSFSQQDSTSPFARHTIVNGVVPITYDGVTEQLYTNAVISEGANAELRLLSSSPVLGGKLSKWVLKSAKPDGDDIERELLIHYNLMKHKTTTIPLVIPKVYLHLTEDGPRKAYVMEKLDIDFENWIKMQLHLVSFEKIVDRIHDILNKIKSMNQSDVVSFRHNDFHVKNVMFRDSESDEETSPTEPSKIRKIKSIKIIDFGRSYIKTSDIECISQEYVQYLLPSFSEEEALKMMHIKRTDKFCPDVVTFLMVCMHMFVKMTWDKSLNTKLKLEMEKLVKIMDFCYLELCKYTIIPHLMELVLSHSERFKNITDQNDIKTLLKEISKLDSFLHPDLRNEKNIGEFLNCKVIESFSYILPSIFDASNDIESKRHVKKKYLFFYVINVILPISQFAGYFIQKSS